MRRTILFIILTICSISLCSCGKKNENQLLVNRETSNTECSETLTKEETTRFETEKIIELTTEEILQEEMTVESEESDINNEKTVIVEIDPGHGGHKIGAENEKKGVLEKNLNLQIAQYMKEELETYKNVKVFLTRKDDSHVELDDRVQRAVEDEADVLISLHNNARGDICDYYNGCTILVARGVFREEQAMITQELGCYVLAELEKLGSENQGLMFRITEDNLYYENGELCDYYSIVRNSVKANIPGIIIEHGFLDNDSDYELLFSTDEKVKNLGIADATAVAAYYQLKKQDGSENWVRLSDYTEKITEISTGYYQDNVYYSKTYFK